MLCIVLWYTDIQEVASRSFVSLHFQLTKLFNTSVLKPMLKMKYFMIRMLSRTETQYVCTNEEEASVTVKVQSS